MRNSAFPDKRTDNVQFMILIAAAELIQRRVVLVLGTKREESSKENLLVTGSLRQKESCFVAFPVTISNDFKLTFGCTNKNREIPPPRGKSIQLRDTCVSSPQN